MSERLFHLLRDEDARAWLAPGVHELRPASLAGEGFVHLSFAQQLEGTLRHWFAGVPRAWLLELDPARLGQDLRLEPSRDAALFPHLYRPLRRTDVVRVWCCEAGSGAGQDPPRAPRLAEEPAADRPQGSPVARLWP